MSSFPVNSFPFLRPAALMYKRLGRTAAEQSLLLRAALWGTVILLTLLAVFTLPAVSYPGRVYPSVQVADIPIGGRSEADARTLVRARVTVLAQQPITLTAGDRRWTALPANLGISYDAERTVDTAMAVGRGHSLHGGSRQTGDRAYAPTVPMAITLDLNTLNAYLDQVEGELGGAPVDAAVRLTGTVVTVTPARDGYAIDREATRNGLLAQIERLHPVTLEVSGHQRPAAVSTEQAAAVKAALDRALAEPIVLTLDAEEWQLAPTELARLVEVSASGDGAGTLTARLNEKGLQSLVADIAAEVDTTASDAWVEDLGTHQRLVPAVHGRTLRQDELIQAVQHAFTNGKHRLALPTEDVAVPEATTDDVLADLGVTEVLATGNSDFAGSGTARTQNVELAVNQVNGTLVPPGGVFSFNDALGSMFEVAGFVEAGSYIDGPSGKNLGGGVCQVSTTVFRAALAGGLPIVEWWPHSYRTSYYEQGGWTPGFDASIVQDKANPEASTDFRFENTTGAWLLLRASIHDETILRVELHGAPTGYVVKLDEPVVEVIQEASGEALVEVDPNLPPNTVVEDQPALDGVRVTVVRRIYNAAGEQVATDTFVSSYRPLGAVRRVSSDRAG